MAVIVNNLKGSRDLIEIRKKKKLAKFKRHDLAGQNFGSKNSLSGESNVSEGLDKLFDEQHNIDNYYPPYLSNRSKELISSYYKNLASIDHAKSTYQKQQKLLDELMELAVKNNEIE